MFKPSAMWLLAAVVVAGVTSLPPAQSREGWSNGDVPGVVASSEAQPAFVVIDDVELDAVCGKGFAKDLWGALFKKGALTHALSGPHGWILSGVLLAKHLWENRRTPQVCY